MISCLTFIAANDSILSDKNETCGANAFMLRDAVCDEATNNEICLFDGGDCCLEFKVTNLCKNCSCILAVDPKKLEQQSRDLEIKPFINPAEFGNVTVKSIVKVEDVISGPVCAVLCSDPEKGDVINAWQYRENQRTCQCSWIESTSCPQTFVNMDWTMNFNKRWTLNTFVQLAKTIPCGKNIYLILMI